MKRASLNHTYRLIWNDLANTWVAVSEYSKARGKRAQAASNSSHVRGLGGLLLGIGLCLGSAGAMGDNVWSVASGDWATGSNWSSGAAPLNSDSVPTIIDNGRTATVSTTAEAGVQLVLGSTAGTSGTLSVVNGGHLTMGNVGIVVGDNGTGTVTVVDGGAISGNGDLLLGNAAGATGTVRLSGSTSTWHSSGAFVGYYGTGNLEIDNGASMYVVAGAAMAIGRYGTGTLTLSNGGLLEISGLYGQLYLARDNAGTATINIGAGQGATAVAPGTLTARAIHFGPGTSNLVFNHTATDYSFSPIIYSDVSGAGNIGLYSGTTSFSGNLAAFTGTMTVDGGTLAVASGNTLSLGGNYIQTANGTLKIGVADNTHYGQISALNATLGGALFVDAASATLTSGLLGHVISTEGSVTGRFASVSDNSSLFNFTPVYNASSVDLTVTAAGGGGGGSSSSGSTDLTAYSAVTAMHNSPAVSAARVLDDIFQSNPTGEISQAFYGLNGTQAVSNAVAQTLPLMTAGMNQVAVNALHSTNRVIQSRQDANHGMSSGDDFLGDRKFWLKPVGSWTRQDNRKGVAGYNADTYGLVGGADGAIDEATRIGVAFSYMNSNVDGKSTSSGNSADIDAYQLITYGSHDLASISDMAINWQADIGVNKNSGHRAITFGGLNRGAKSDYDSLTAHAGLGLSRNYQLSETTTVTPGIRADYTWLRDEGYTEKGAGALNLNVKGHSTDELILMAEGRITHKLNDKAALVGNAGLGYDVLHGNNSVTSSYVGGGAAFQTRGMDVSPWLARAGAGVVYNATETTEITARYDLEARSDFLDQTASVKVRWAF